MPAAQIVDWPAGALDFGHSILQGVHNYCAYAPHFSRWIWIESIQLCF
jgi:hypothetical protein